MALVDGESKNFRTIVREDYEAVRRLTQELGGNVELGERDVAAVMCLPLGLSLGGLMNALTYGVEQGDLAYRTARGAEPAITNITGIYSLDPNNQQVQ